jgi:asparagine synthase (glutamine-hydrolysing)
MCGIWGYLTNPEDDTNVALLYKKFSTIQSRGPDNSIFLRVKNIFMGFHRLSIMGPGSNGNQPFISNVMGKTVYTMCNGEIYDYQYLITKYDLNPVSNSDCEIIPLLYEKIGIVKLMEEIKGGEFALSIITIDNKTNDVTVCLARDPMGVRPLYYSYTEHTVAFSSDFKGLTDNLVNHKNIREFPPGTYMMFNLNEGKYTKETYKYYNLNKIKIIDETLDQSLIRVKDSLIESVKVMMMSDCAIGALTSGGLDSSLITAIASKEHLRTKGTKLKTFSIGIPGSTDEKYARMVAEHCGTDHTHVEVSNDIFLYSIKEVIEAVGTYDITTIRASTGQYLISKWISENTDIKCLLTGDGSDELCSGYLYFHNAPSPEESHKENIRLLEDIHMYDIKRADRGVAENGLEARVPFLRNTFVETYLSINYKRRVPHNGVEKWLLREAFKDTDLLPDEVLFRKKEAFSDGVSSVEKSWYVIIQEYCDKYYTDKRFEHSRKLYTHLPPHSKEALYFRLLYREIFGLGLYHLIPYYWLPKWCGNIVEPSARILNIQNNY